MWGFEAGAVASGVLQAGQRLAKPGLSGFSSNSSEQTAQTLMGKAMEVHDNPGDQTSPRPLEILGARDRKPSPGEASVFSGSCSELRDRQDGNALEVTGGALDDVLDCMPTLGSEVRGLVLSRRPCRRLPVRSHGLPVEGSRSAGFPPYYLRRQGDAL